MAEQPSIIWQCVKTYSTPVVHIKIAGKWMFIPLKMVLIGIDPSPSVFHFSSGSSPSECDHIDQLSSKKQ